MQIAEGQVKESAFGGQCVEDGTDGADPGAGARGHAEPAVTRNNGGLRRLLSRYGSDLRPIAASMRPIAARAPTTTIIHRVATSAIFVVLRCRFSLFASWSPR